MKLNQNNNINSAQDPFVYLWLTNCALYAVVVAFLMVKGWMRKNTSQIGKGKVEDEQKEMYERQAGEIQKNISIAKAEIERIKSNRKITRKGRRNQVKLLKSCKVVSVAALVEKEKSKLRKLKRSFVWRKKLDEARQVNQKFQQDPKVCTPVLEKCLKINKKTRSQGTIELCYKGNRMRGCLKILKKQANFGEHYGKEPEVETLEWNGLRMLERQ